MTRASFALVAYLSLALALLAAPTAEARAPLRRSTSETRRPKRIAPATKARAPKASSARSSVAPPRATGLGRLRGGVSNIAPPGEDDLERRLQEELDAILDTRFLKSAVNGVYVVDVRTGRVLYSFGADRQLNPASNVKLVSTATALDVLGAQFRYETRLLGRAPDAEGVVRGDLYLLGSGDPMLRLHHLAALARRLRARGIVRITGDIVVGTSPIRDALGHSQVTVTVTGGSRAGERPRVTVSPDSSLFRVTTTAVTTTRGRRSRIGVGIREVRDEGATYLWLTVSGKIRANRRWKVTRRVPSSVLFTAYSLRSFLQAEGIEVEGGVRREPQPPDGLSTLALHESAPMSVLAAKVNKPSWNWLADRIVWTAGAALYGGDPDNDKGVRAMQAWLGGIGIEPGSYRVDNGSGLSYTNHMSARQIVQVLLAAYQNFRIGPDYVASLAIGGRDGTLRGRFRGHPSEGWVRGKTGTLHGVAALSGFVSAGGEDMLCFAILTNGFRNRRKQSIRTGQAQMVDAMYRYLARRHEAKTGRAAPPPPTEMQDLDPGGDADAEATAAEQAEFEEREVELDPSVPEPPLLKPF